jgi:hypothetical protein
MCVHGKVLEFQGEDLEHGVAGDECGGAEGHRRLVTGAVVLAADLVYTHQDTQSIECGDIRGQEAVEHGVNVPAVEARRAVCLCLPRSHRSCGMSHAKGASDSPQARPSRSYIVRRQ